MVKGKLYEYLTSVAMKKDGYSGDNIEIFNEIKKEFNIVPDDSSFSPSDMMGDWMDHPDDFASGAEVLKRWYHKYFGDEM